MQTGNSISQICSSYYTVQSGDTCSDILIAARNGLSLSDLFSLNPGLNCDQSSQLLSGEQVGIHTLYSLQMAESAESTCCMHDSVWRLRTAFWLLLSIHEPSCVPFQQCMWVPFFCSGDFRLLISSIVFGVLQVCVQGGSSITLVGASLCSTGKYYTVQKGDSCSSIIVKKYSSKTAYFIKYNSGLICTNSRLYVGQKLCLPP